jgi:hypothetical protein
MKESEMHKDQQRLQDVFLPQLAGRIVEETPEAERDCTVLNRMLIQGPDPLFIMEACPEEFGRLCGGFDLTPAEGREAIEKAHWMGPGALLEGKGLDPEWMNPGGPDGIEFIADVPKAHRTEALWLVLASLSDCTEEGYGSDATLLDRIRKAADAAMGMAKIAELETIDLMDVACDTAKKFLTETPWRTDPLFGKPLADGDHAFYVGYKLGHPCVAATSGELTFYGTIPSTSLAEQGVTVGKELSPQFGIVFG